MSAQEAKRTVPESEMHQAIMSAKILVVDDMALMRQMIGICLAKGGYKNVLFASDGDEALELVEEEAPDLLILDLNMPKVSGYEVCRTLRDQKRHEELPILVQSASETPEERVEVFASGATDFVSKPINQPELLARVYMHLENRSLIHSLTDFRERMQAELVMARDMQQSLLPEPSIVAAIEKASTTKIESYYQASFELGGDLWGVWLLEDGRVGLFVLDISGHGVGAALNTFRVHATMARFVDVRHDPATFLTELNAALAPTFPLGQFATMFYTVIDYETGEMTYAGAGAPRPLVVSERGVRLLDSSGVPVGIIKKPDYVNITDKLEADESLFCYSDVLIEAPQSGGDMLGEDGLISWVQELATEGDRHSLVERLLKRFYATQSALLPDDLTAVAIHPAGGVADA